MSSRMFLGLDNGGVFVGLCLVGVVLWTWFRAFQLDREADHNAPWRPGKDRSQLFHTPIPRQSDIERVRPYRPPYDWEKHV